MVLSMISFVPLKICSCAMEQEDQEVPDSASIEWLLSHTPYH